MAGACAPTAGTLTPAWLSDRHEPDQRLGYRRGGFSLDAARAPRLCHAQAVAVGHPPGIDPAAPARLQLPLQPPPFAPPRLLFYRLLQEVVATEPIALKQIVGEERGRRGTNRENQLRSRA